MAKITLLNNANPSFNNAGIIRSREKSINEIVLHPEFKKLFHIDKQVLNRITQSIIKHGFDCTQPLHLWESEGILYLIDGYTRYSAAKKAGLERVPCHLHTEIQTQEEAYQYALRLQINRRNLTESELLIIISQLTAEFTNNKKKDNTASGRMIERIAEEIKISPRTVQKYQTINRKAPKEIKRAIEEGKITINQAYKEIVSGSKSLHSAQDSKTYTDHHKHLIEFINKKVIELESAESNEQILKVLNSIINQIKLFTREIE